MPPFMDHIVLNADDEYALLAFYIDIVGLLPDRVVLYRQGKVTFPSVRINDDIIIDIFPRSLWSKGEVPTTGKPNLNHFCLCFSRQDWEKLKERLAAAGVEIIDGPDERWGAHGMGVSMYFRDPEGNTIEAKYYYEHTETSSVLEI